MSLAADSNTATRVTPTVTPDADPASPDEHGVPDSAVEQALAAAVADADRIGELLDVLRSARLWLPLPADGKPVVTGGAVTLPTVSYLGSEFVPAYSSARLLQQFGRRETWPEPPLDNPGGDYPASGSQEAPPVPVQRPEPLPHVVVRAADLA